MAMTLQQFMQATGARPVMDEESGQVRGLDAPVKDANYWQNFAKLLGYEGADPGKFLLGMVNADGSPIAPGQYRGSPSGWENAPGVREFIGQYGWGGLTKDIQNASAAAGEFALGSGGGVNPAEYFGGQIDRGGSGIFDSIKDFATQPAVLASLGAAGAAALGGAGAAGGAIDYTSGAGLESLISGAGAPTAAGTTSLGAGATGLSGVGPLASEAGFVPGSFELGTTAAGGAAATGLGAAAPNITNTVTQGLLSKIMSGTATADDWAKIAGSVAPGVLGYFGADKQSDSLTGISNQLRADRAPALNAFNTALANPNEFYNSAPSMGALDAVLRKLSVGGNPAANPGSLAQAAAYNLGGYNDYLKTLSGPAFGTAGAETNVNIAGAGADAGKFNAGGWTLGNLLSPPTAGSEMMKQLALSIGGMKFP